MTEPIAASAGRLAPLALEAVVQVRHDLRIFVNQILGYSEMLLETAAEEGPAELIAPLHRINDLGKDVLDLIRDRLNPGRTEFVPTIFSASVRIWAYPSPNCRPPVWPCCPG